MRLWMRKTARGRKVAGLAIAVAIAAAMALPASAAADDVKTATNDAGLGLATVLANLFYVPVKVGYAAVGGVTGGLAWAVTGGNKHVAERIWVPSVGGDYVLTSNMVAGEEDIDFSGSTDPDL